MTAVRHAAIIASVMNVMIYNTSNNTTLSILILQYNGKNLLFSHSTYDFRRGP